ncbi:hypothetical protein EN784_54970, partial [bacterium M00.F.Ca.ET.141.01.1.1]
AGTSRGTGRFHGCAGCSPAGGAGCSCAHGTPRTGVTRSGSAGRHGHHDDPQGCRIAGIGVRSPFGKTDVTPPKTIALMRQEP